MFDDISCVRTGNKEECLVNARVVKVLAKKFGIGQWSFIGPGSETKWSSGEENSPQGAWDHIVDEMLLESAESRHPTFRATTPLSRGILKSKGQGTLSIRFTADYPTIETVFRIIFCQSAHNVKNLKLIKMDQSNLMFLWVNQLFSVKSRQRFLCRMKTLQIIKFHGNSTWNELDHFHQKAK